MSRFLYSPYREALSFVIVLLFILSNVIHLTTLQGEYLHESMLSSTFGDRESIGTDKVYISKIYEREYTERKAIVTAYNTVPQQTDSTPCISADGSYVCGRKDVVACPRDIPFGTRVAIDGRNYYCHDRTASKYNGRFDISFDDDMRGAKEWGIREVTVKIYK